MGQLLSNDSISKEKKMSDELDNISIPFADIRKDYIFGMVIGRGSFAEVRLCKRRNNQIIHAAKSIYKPKIDSEKLNQLFFEINLLKTLDHPNIIKFSEAYQDDKYLHIIIEYCEGGELFDKIVSEKKLSEFEISQIIYTVLHALSYCHLKGIVHRDLKPENILLNKKDKNFKGIKLIDFGLSAKFDRCKLDAVLGSPPYLAPEVIKGSYGPQCDIWSLGVITFLMLSGTLPFKSQTVKGTFEATLFTEPSFTDSLWDSVSPEAISFVKKCLEKNPIKRITAYRALDDPWFKSKLITEPNDEHSQQVLIRLKKFGHKETLKKMIIKCVLNNFITQEEMSILRMTFQEFDKDRTGYITLEELDLAFKNANLQINEKELKRILEYCDDSNNNKLNYTEYLVGTADPDIYTNEKTLNNAFKYFDADSSGFICEDDIKNVLMRSGEKCDIDILQSIKEVSNGKSQLSLSDFVAIFNKSKPQIK